MKKIDWDTYFMTMVYLVAMRSKDESTHIGAVVVGPDHEIRFTGYNSFVRGINDNLPERQQRPEKYLFMEHGERNAIYNAALIGVSLKGCTMYTNGVPCMDCARAVIQAGIKIVVVDQMWNNDNDGQWKESCDKAEKLLQEASVKIWCWNGELLDVKKFRKGKSF